MGLEAINVVVEYPITCPKCEVMYRKYLAPGETHQLRCGNCGHTWEYEAELVEEVH